MRLVVTGRAGQLVRSLVERGAEAGVEIVCLARPEFDLLEPGAIARGIDAARGEVIINAAAYTAVDKAETEVEIASRVNRDGARAVATAAASCGRPVVQVSTDYVFDGALDRPYIEEDAVGPLNAYGQTKLAGEYAVAEANPRHIIARTSWTYSPFGHNFVKTMLRLGLSRGEVSVVADQWGAPTSALDLAEALIAIARQLVVDADNSTFYGVFNITGPSHTNWARLAEVIFAEAETRGRRPVNVRKITTAQYPTPAARPSNSRLNVGKLKRVFGLALPEWPGSARECVRRVLASADGESGSS